MDSVLFYAFLTTLVFLAVPGPSVAFATAQALRCEPRTAYVAVARDALGTMVHVTVAAVGFTALVALSKLILPSLQIVGGIFVLCMEWTAFKNIGKPTSDVLNISDKATF